MWEEQYRQLVANAARQHGLITDAQARRLGVDDAQLGRFVAAQLLHGLGSSVYQIAGGDRGLRYVLPYAAWLAMAPETFRWERPREPADDVVLSHESACELLGLGGARSSVTRFTAATERLVPRGTRVTVATLTPDDVMLYEGVPVTSPHRTILDLIAEGDATARGMIGAVVTDAVRKDQVNLRALYEDIAAQPEVYDLPAYGAYFVDYFLPGLRAEWLSPRNLRAYAELAETARIVEIRPAVDRLLREVSGVADERLGAGIAAEIAARTGNLARGVRRIDWDWDQDEIESGDDLRLEYHGEPYTGEIVRHGFEGLLSHQSYVNGIAHGPDTEWWADGTLRSAGQLRYGTPYGDYRFWHRNGQLACVKHFGEDGTLHRVEEWDQAGNQTRER
jgi:hypothetical protein